MSSNLPSHRSTQDRTGAESARSSSDEKDHYSIDEIMDSLKESEREKDDRGEMVTREDGTRARKVRKRKRRSEQPEGASSGKTSVGKASKAEKELKRKRSTKLKFLVGAGALLVVVAGALFLLLKYNGPAYQEAVEDQASEWSGGKVELEKLRILPSNISADEAAFSWPEGHFVRSLDVRKVMGHAGIPNFFGGQMGGREVGAARGKLTLAAPAGSPSLIEGVDEDDFPFHFQRYFVSNLDAVFGSSDLLSIEGTHASLRHLQGGGWQLYLDEGTLNLQGWEPFPLHTGLLKFSPQEVDITTLRLGMPESLSSIYDPYMGVKGKISLVPGTQSTLELESRNFPIGGLIGHQLSQLMEGSVRVVDKAFVRFTAGHDELDEVQIPFEGEMLTLKRFPFVRDLDELFPDHGLEILKFDGNIEGIYRKGPQGETLRNLQMSRLEVLRLQGDLAVDRAGKLGGKLRLLISQGMIKLSPELIGNPAFANKRGGYAVIEVQVGGTVQYPEDNFRQLLGMDEAPGSGHSPAASSADFEQLFEELTVPNPAQEAEMLPSQDLLLQDNSSQ